MTRSRLRLAAPTLALLVSASPTSAAVWSVLPDGSGDLPTVAAALTVAQPGDVVELGAGVYFESGLTLPDGVVLRSVRGFAGDVILDAQGNGRVMTAVAVNAGTLIEGITFRGGSITPPCADPGAGTYCLAGGVLLLDATLELRRCVFRDNRVADNGGAVSSVLSAPRFVECVFEANTATHGGAISFVASERRGEVPTLDGCFFLGNVAAADAGAVYAYESRPSIRRCTFRANRCGQQGSAIFWQSRAPATLDHTLIVSGEGEAPFFCGVGGAAPVLLCCNVWDNSGGDWVDCLASQRGQAGNLSADPHFCNATSAGIDEASPCLPNTVTGCGTIGAGPVECRSGVSGPPQASTWGRVKATFLR